MVGILILQVIYKALFLTIFILPLWRSEGIGAIPTGLTLCFAAIVAVWPVFLWKTFPGAAVARTGYQT